MLRSKHSLDLFLKLAARMGAYNHGVLIFMGANKYSKLCLDLNCVSHYVHQSYYQASIQLFFTTDGEKTGQGPERGLCKHNK